MTVLSRAVIFCWPSPAVILRFGPCRDPWEYFCSFKDNLHVLKQGLLFNKWRGSTTTAWLFCSNLLLIFTLLPNCPKQSSNFLLAVASTVIPGFRPCWNEYFSFQNHLCILKRGLLFDTRRGWSFYDYSVHGRVWCWPLPPLWLQLSMLSPTLTFWLIILRWVTILSRAGLFSMRMLILTHAVLQLQQDCPAAAVTYCWKSLSISTQLHLKHAHTYE
jgi:hypothetical protein